MGQVHGKEAGKAGPWKTLSGSAAGLGNSESHFDSQWPSNHLARKLEITNMT